MEALTYYINRFAENPINHILDIILVAAAFYGIFLLIKRTRAEQLLRGVIILVVLLVLISVTVIDLTASRWLITAIVPALLVAIPVIFQPELRRALEQLGRADRFLRSFKRESNNPVVGVIAQTCLQLSRRRDGALIVIEQDTGLQEYIDTGIILNAEITPELLLTVFNKHTELHDGAVIIRKDKIAAAACVLPLSTRSLSDRQMGLRHRASLGISEVSDAIVIVVSEETGQISIAHNGRIIRRQDPKQLENILNAFLLGQPGELPPS